MPQPASIILYFNHGLETWNRLDIHNAELTHQVPTEEQGCPRHDQRTSGYHNCKAGRLVGFADCYAVIVLADNATFLLAVNRIAASRSDSAIITHKTTRSRGSVGRASAP